MNIFHLQLTPHQHLHQCNIQQWHWTSKSYLVNLFSSGMCNWHCPCCFVLLFLYFVLFFLLCRIIKIIIIYIRLSEAKIYQRIERFCKKYPDDSNIVSVKVPGLSNIASILLHPGILTLARASHAAPDATLTMLGKLDLRVLTPRRIKCAFSLHNAQHKVIYKNAQ